MAIQVIRRLLRLRDVNADDIEDGETLVWDADNSEFIPGSGGGGGGAPTDATYITQTANGDLSAEQALSSLSTGLVKVTTTTGVLSTAVANTDYPSVTHATRHQNGGADEISIAGLDGIPTELQTHLDDTSDAHDASAISIADAGNDFTATDVEGALAELQADHETDAQNLTDHIGDSSAAHAASAISVDSTNLSGTATDVQGSLGELDNLLDDHSSRHEDGGADEISIAGLSGTSAALQAHLDDTADAHDASAISVADSGGNFTGTDVEAVLAELQDNIDGVGGGSTDGWTADSDTWTYASASTFTVSGDVTARFSKGTRLKFTQTTVKYAVVVASNHAAGTTTVTIAVNTDYTLANAAITATYYSYDVNPQGYPAQFAYTPAWTSSGTQPAIVNGTITGSFSIVGNMCDVKVNISMGGSTTFGTGTYSISYPVTEVTGGVEANGMCLLFDSSVSGFYPAMWRAGSLMQLATVPSSFAANNAPFTWASSDQMQLSNRYRI